MNKKRYTKYTVDMYENRKMKIINKMKERDLIFYVWNRCINLATIVDKQGDLYITSKNPYTVSALAIEFDRSEEEIQTALNVLLQLEMVTCNDNVYKVKNWTNHNSSKRKKSSEQIEEQISERESSIEVLDKLINPKAERTEVNTKDEVNGEINKEEKIINNNETSFEPSVNKDVNNKDDTVDNNEAEQGERYVTNKNGDLVHVFFGDYDEDEEIEAIEVTDEDFEEDDCWGDATAVESEDNISWNFT